MRGASAWVQHESAATLTLLEPSLLDQGRALERHRRMIQGGRRLEPARLSRAHASWMAAAAASTMTADGEYNIL